MNPRHTREHGRKERGSSYNGFKRYRKVEPSNTGRAIQAPSNFRGCAQKRKLYKSLQLHMTACLRGRICLLVKLILTACIIWQSQAARCTLQAIVCAPSLGAEPKNAVGDALQHAGNVPCSQLHARLRHGDRTATWCLCSFANVLRGLESLACTHSGARVECVTSQVFGDEIWWC